MMAAAAVSLKLSNLIPWYHGPITRNAAVSLLEAEGDFLVRDCISNPGDYVLTCMSENGKALHFKLNRVSIENEEWYQFEGEVFPSAVSLIEHHLSTLEPISLSSNAVITRPKGKNDAIYVKLNHLDHRSQSSMSSTSASTASSGGGGVGGTGMQLTKSGSRASLLKDTPKDCSTTPCELKRFKSLPAGRIRRVKRRAPSPPKDKKPFSAVQSKVETNGGGGDQQQPSKKTTPKYFLEGVKLRRKKFSQLIPKPLNLSQRQSLHVTTAHLHDYLKRSLPTCTLSKEKRRYSMPRLLDDSDIDEDGEETSANSAPQNQNHHHHHHHQLVRSPSDTSLMYLSQLSTFFASAADTKKPPPPSLPCKRRTTRICPDVAPQVHQQQTAVEKERQREAIYDCLPKPRPCLTEEQIRFNEIYDVPRNLLISASKQSSIGSNPDYFPRSMSAFSRVKTATNSSLLRQSECVSVCGGGSGGGNGIRAQRGCNPTMQQQELNGLNRHRNYVDDLHKGKPALPPKSRKGFYAAGKEELYDNPRHLMSNSDCISLCSNFSYCSQCTNTDSNVELTDSVVAAGVASAMSLPQLNDEDSLRFSPTSLFSEDSVSLRDFDFDMPYLEAQRSCREYSCRSLSGSGKMMLPEMSTLSSVSSVTLQGDDDLSVDTISLPEDPFPHGLPSSASSTIGSPVSSRSSFSKSSEEDDLNLALPFSQEDSNEEEKNLTENGTFTEAQLKDEELSVEDRATSSSSTTTPTIEANLELEPLMPSDAADVAKAEEVGEESSCEAIEEEFDIFNHRSSSRLTNGKVKTSELPHWRCKSQPHSLDAMLRDDDPIWMAHSHGEAKVKERKSLSPNVLKAMVAGEACSWDKSLFEPGSYMTLFLPITSNKPLDPMAVSAVHRTLVDTPAPLLAVHLTYLDLCFFGLLHASDGKGRLHRQAPHRQGDLKRLSDPNSWRYRLDTLERFLCLRTFVEMSILAASNLRESTRVLCKWIKVAEETDRRLKNLFGFHCIVSSLKSSPYLRDWEGLWDQLKEEHCQEYNLLNGAISCSIQEMVTTDISYSQSAGVTVPNVMPYVVGTLRTLKETSCIIEDLCEELIPLEQQQQQQQQPYLYASMTIDGFKKNAQMAFRHVNNFDDLLFDLFRTEFHIRLFWGTNGVTDFPHNFNERHTKFAKVLSALASICARQ